MDFAELEGPLSALLGRAIRVPGTPLPRPNPLLQKRNLAGFEPPWSTDAFLRERLAELVKPTR